MVRSLRVAVADDERELRDYFQETLATLGHRVVCVASSGEELVAGCRAERPELVITDIRMPGLDGIDAARTICGDQTVPVILISAYHDEDLVERAAQARVFAFLVKPIKKADLEAAIPVCLKRFSEFQLLQREAQSLRQALEDRKVVERAKGVLMRLAGMDEQAAFQRLQKLASDNNKKLVEIAASILMADQAMRPREER